MKKLLSVPVTLLLIFFSTGAYAQQVGALTIFSEGGEKFYLILNGLRQNNEARTNVRVDGLTQPNYNVKIIFEDKAFPEISRNYLMIADADQKMMDVTYRIKHDKNGSLKLGAMPTSFTPYQQNAPVAPDVTVVHYGQPETTTVSQTTTTTTTTTAPNNSVNVNVNGLNMGVTINDPALNNTTVQTTTTHTTTTTTNTEAVAPPVQHEEHAHHGCAGAYPMSSSDFSSALGTIENEGFDDTKLSIAKQISGSNCLSTNQITEVCKLFGFEETKLKFAKFAYDRCTEPNNYFKVNNVFNFSSSKDELTKYIQGR
jgi:hypothetical protein